MNLSPRVETYHKQYLSPTSLTSIDSAQAFNYEMTNYIFNLQLSFTLHASEAQTFDSWIIRHLFSASKNQGCFLATLHSDSEYIFRQCSAGSLQITEKYTHFGPERCICSQFI